MDQTSVIGQAFRVLTDAANGVYHKISLWTHADDVEMRNGDTLTEAMKSKYDIDNTWLTIRSMSDIPSNSAGFFNIDSDVGSLTTLDVTLVAGESYTFVSFVAPSDATKLVLVGDFNRANAMSPMHVFYKRSSGSWMAHTLSTDIELELWQAYLERQIGALDLRKYGYEKDRIKMASLNDLPMNASGSAVVVASSGKIGYYDKKTNITTTIMPGEYVFFSYQNSDSHKFVLLFSNTQQESDLLLGGGYICTNSGSASSAWVITRILSPTDFSTDETGLREQIVASLTGQLWPVGAIYMNLTRQNPGDYLGGTWNLITEGIITAINGSVEQTGYHQRDLYKAVKDEDRGEHLYGVFVWQRIA